jgi:hypothetical protein
MGSGGGKAGSDNSPRVPKGYRRFKQERETLDTLPE